MKKLENPLFLILLVFCQFHSQITFAQSQSSLIDKREISKTIDSIGKKLEANYIFPDVASEMRTALEENFANGKYDTLSLPESLAKQLTDDLREVSKDKHLLVVYNPQIIARENAMSDEDRANEEAEWIKTWVSDLERDNYGIKKADMLEGNIGYLDLREFIDPKYSEDALAQAMRRLSGSETFILDLRNNDGGHPDMVELVASYFFKDEPVLLANHYDRPKNEKTESWTRSSIIGKRMPEVDLFILTSSKTFSAAEAMSYFMQQLDRATIIGENTAGGAHLTGSVIATDKFYVRIPQGRPTSPITNSNWEGVGVIPDIEAVAENALEVALQQVRSK